MEDEGKINLRVPRCCCITEQCSERWKCDMNVWRAVLYTNKNLKLVLNETDEVPCSSVVTQFYCGALFDACSPICSRKQRISTFCICSHINDVMYFDRKNRPVVVSDTTRHQLMVGQNFFPTAAACILCYWIHPVKSTDGSRDQTVWNSCLPNTILERTMSACFI